MGSSRRAIALPFVMLIIALLLIGVATISKQGLGSLNQARVTRLSKQAVFAAESGASDAARRLVVDDSWEGPLVAGRGQDMIFQRAGGSVGGRAPAGVNVIHWERF